MLFVALFLMFIPFPFSVRLHIVNVSTKIRLTLYLDLALGRDEDNGCKLYLLCFEANVKIKKKDFLTH